MPELPEVETSRRGIEPHILQRRIERVIVRQHRLRWPVPETLPALCRRQTVEAVHRRGKYLLLQLQAGTVLLHLGMSGSLRIVGSGQAADKHDHIDFCFDNDKVLRLHDPRKFGCVLWAEPPVEHHPLLASLGPEPLDDDFDGDYLFERSRQRRVNVKTFIMNSQVVVGVGNIYASESLFRAAIHPGVAAGRISRKRYRKLADAIRETLRSAIRAGGTTLRDFTDGEGKPGYFAQQLSVYGRQGEDCQRCGASIRQTVQQQRSTFYCPRCQRR